MDLKPQFLQLTKGDAAAAEFLLSMNFVCRIWDDLIDKDKPTSDEDVCRAFWTCLIELPRNPFYLRHFQELNPLLGLLIQNWMCSNALSQGGEQDRRIAFVIRCCESDLATQVALVCGGYEWAKEMAPTIRRLWHHQSFDKYASDLDRKANEPRLAHPATGS